MTYILQRQNLNLGTRKRENDFWGDFDDIGNKMNFSYWPRGRHTIVNLL